MRFDGLSSLYCFFFFVSLHSLSSLHRVIRIVDLRRQTGVRAVASGIRFGRKPMLTYHQQQEAIKRLNAGKETQGEIARSYNVSRWTISRLS